MTLNQTSDTAKTVPVYFAGLQGQIEGVPWPQVAAGADLRRADRGVHGPGS